MISADCTLYSLPPFTFGGGYVFTPRCLFVTCKIEEFSCTLVSRFCYSVSLSVGPICENPEGPLFLPEFVGLICENPEGPLFLPEFVCLSVCLWMALLPVSIGQF